MGKLYDAKCKLDQIIQDRKLDLTETRGKIGLKAGFLLSLVNQGTADDDAKLQKLTLAAKEILGVSL